MTEENKPTGNTVMRRIGSTTYLLHLHFSENATETMEEKILRVISCELSTNDEKCGIIKEPQMNRPA